MHFNLFDLTPMPDFPIWKYLAVLAALQALPLTGLDCCYGWTLIQGEHWFEIAMGLSLPVLFLLEGVLLVFRRIAGAMSRGDET